MRMYYAILVGNLPLVCHFDSEPRTRVRFSAAAPIHHERGCLIPLHRNFPNQASAAVLLALCSVRSAATPAIVVVDFSSAVHFLNASFHLFHLLKPTDHPIGDIAAHWFHIVCTDMLHAPLAVREQL